MVWSNKSSFWSTIKRLQGESKHKELISLMSDDKMISDPGDVADIFGRLFSDKVRLLSNNCGQYQWARQSAQTPVVTLTELENAINSIKTKMCSGPDGIPLKPLKHSSPAILSKVLLLMNLSM